MENSKFGLFTPYTLRFHRDYYGEEGSKLIKRNLILFESLTYIAPMKQDKEFLSELFATDNTKLLSEMKPYFHPILEFVSEEQISHISFTVDPNTNMWHGPHGDRYDAFVRKHLNMRFGITLENSMEPKNFQILDFYMSALTSDMNFLLRLSNCNPEISGLFSELHRDAYLATYGNETISSGQVLEKICSLNYFDFGNLTWEQILELKRSHFISDFRKKIDEWLIDFIKTKDEQLFEKNLDRFIKTSQFEFLQQNKPNNIKDGILNALGEIPMPYGLPNPISIYSSGSQLIKNEILKKDFGWLFFIQEGFTKSKEIME